MSGLGIGYFYTCAALAIAGAIFTVANRNPIRGAMGLMTTVVSIAGLFLALHAQFLAVIQLIVYAGAIVVLFLFVIMLLGPSAVASRDHRGRVTRIVSGSLFGLASLLALYVVVKPAWTHAMRLGQPNSDFGSIDAVGKTLFSSYVVPFELSSALLLVAIVGAVAVARGRHKSDAESRPVLPPAEEGE